MAATTKELLKFDVLNRYSGELQFTAEISCAADALPSIKLGLAVRWAVKNKADLSSADLSSADLRSADLSSADLSSADLRSADLRYADLRYADLRSANLSSANLRYADLRYANLRYADLRYANLSSAENSELAIAMTRILPDGDLVGWKKCAGGVIVKLLIPYAAKRSHAFGRKCRAEYVQVIEVIGAEVAIAQHDGKTEYRAGAIVKPDSFSENWVEECSNGIHFFITRIEAENY